MRELLMTVLLIIVAVLLFTGITGGEEGTNAQLDRSGRHMGESIRRMSP